MDDLKQRTRGTSPREPDLAAELRLSGNRTSERERLPGASLRDADLRGLDLSGLDLTGADLSGADLRESRLIGAVLVDANLFGARLDDAELLGADLSNVDAAESSATSAGFGGAKLTNARFFASSMDGASLTQADLDGADFRTASLRGARIREATLRGSALDRADLQEADLDASTVDRAGFRGCDLRRARLRGVTGYADADWIGANIAETDFCGAYRIRRTIMDQNFLHEFKEESTINRLFYWVWWATSDCGRSMTRWGVLTAAIAVGYAWIFSLTALDLGNHAGPLAYLYFSVVTLTTLGYGDITPSTPLGEMLAISEALVGYLMLGGLISIFSTKMARRAD